MSDHDLDYEKAVIEAANRGEDVYGREALDIIAERIERGLFDSPLFAYLATNLRAYLDQGVPLERALCVEPDLNPGGRPKKYNDTEIAAVDILLPHQALFSPEEANIWIEERIGADRRLVQRTCLSTTAHTTLPTPQNSWNLSPLTTYCTYLAPRGKT